MIDDESQFWNVMGLETESEKASSSEQEDVKRAVEIVAEHDAWFDLSATRSLGSAECFSFLYLSLKSCTLLLAIEIKV